MLRTLTAFILTASAFLACSTARAQVVVADPSNIAVNVEQLLQHLELLRRVDAQIRNQLLMLENWQFTRLDEIVGEAKRIAEVMESAAVYRVDDPRRRIDRLYPIDSTRRNSDTTAFRAEWMRQQREALVQARALQNRVFDSMPARTQRIEQYLERSAASPGPTAAVQAGNELLGTLVGQFQTLEALEITAAREALEREAAHQAEAARTRSRRDSLMRDWPQQGGGVQ